MIDLFERSDPASDAHADAHRLRALVDERVRFTTGPATIRRPWLNASLTFAAVLVVVAVIALLRSDPLSIYAPRLDGIRGLGGITDVIPLASGGVQTAAVEGDTIWVMTALANQLQEISAISAELEMTYPIESYVEGVVTGGGHVWLLSYDDGGEVLRFNPELGAVDLSIPLGGLPAHGAEWYSGYLWISNDQGELLRISLDGAVARFVGELKGAGIGDLWVNDPATGLISNLDETGESTITIPTRADMETAAGGAVRSVVESGGRLWLMDGMFPWGTNLLVFDPDTGELEPFGGLTFGLLSMIEFEGDLWLTSNTDHLLLRVDPDTGEVSRFPLPGKPGGVFVADGSLWVNLYQPGALVRIDPDGLLEAGEIVADDWNRFPHRLLCTGDAAGPTVILEPNDWVDYGSWSVVQAQLSAKGFLVCTNGFVDGEASPSERAAALDDALSEAGIPGPYLLVAAVDGVHTARLFADGRTDIAGVVLVDPIPVGFGDFYDNLLPDMAGHPRWLDLEETLSGDLGDIPLVIIGHDPAAVFLSPQFLDGVGPRLAETVNREWQDGLEVYAGLSSDSKMVKAGGTGLDYVLWDRPDLVVEAVIEVSKNP